MKKIVARLKSSKFDLIIFVSIVILALSAMLSYFLFDAAASRWVFSQSILIDNFAGADLLKSLGKVCVPLWLLFLLGYAKNNCRLVMAASISVLMVLVITGPLKVITKRERPREIYNQNDIISDAQEVQSNSHDQSFPSADTAIAFTCAVVATPLISMLSVPILYILAAGVGVLRVLSTAHYPSDVFAGAAIGIFCGWLALQLSERLASENFLRITEWWKLIVYAGFIIIPTLAFFAGGLDNLLIFVASSAILSGLIFIINKMQTLLF